MITAKEAEAKILEFVQPLQQERDGETVDLLTASGRILASPVTSSLDFPHWDNSAMDGYAVQFADVAESSSENPTQLEIIEEIPAGYQPQKTIQSGQAARIFTGALMPAGADTIIMQEETRRKGERVFILKAPEQPASFVRKKGTYYQAGTPLLSPGIPLNAPEIALLAAAQCQQVSVYRRPRIALFSTGDELIAPDQPLTPGKLVDSNQYALAVALNKLGVEAIRLGIIPDQRDRLRDTIAHAFSVADVVLSTGGVSVGDYDYIEEILTALNAEIQLRAVAIKPGKPLTVATFKRDQTQRSAPTSPGLYFGLPGNPVSTLVTFWRFVQPALKKLCGLSQGWEPEWVQARTTLDLRGHSKLETYIWGQLQLFSGTYEFVPAEGSQTSGNLVNLVQTNGLAAVPMAQTWILAGEPIQVLKIN